LAAERRASDLAAAPLPYSERSASEAPMTSTSDDDVAAPEPEDHAAALAETMAMMREFGTTPERQAAIMLAYNAAAHFHVSRNAIFAWHAIQVLTSPMLGAPSIPLPRSVQDYLHAAAKGIASGADKPGSFSSMALSALRFGGRKGASVAGNHAKHQKLMGFLAAYEVLKDRHGFTEAETLIRKRLNLEPTRVRERLTEARRFAYALFETMGSPLRPGSRTGSRLFDNLSDEELLSRLQKSRLD